jgi:hypothetical protein
VRSDTNPLQVSERERSSAPHTFNVQMHGVPGDLRHAEGVCSPIKSWFADGFDYYYVSCNVALSTGETRVEAVPWPVRYPPNADYFRGTLRKSSPEPLQAPLPGWKIPPGLNVPQELIDYARQQGAEI